MIPYSLFVRPSSSGGDFWGAMTVSAILAATLSPEQQEASFQAFKAKEARREAFIKSRFILLRPFHRFLAGLLGNEYDDRFVKTLICRSPSCKGECGGTYEPTLEQE